MLCGPPVSSGPVAKVPVTLGHGHEAAASRAVACRGESAEKKESAVSSTVEAQRSRLPQDWPTALRATLEGTLASWVPLVFASMGVYLLSSSRDAAAALSLGSAARTGSALWSLGLGGGLTPFAGEGGALTLPLLGLTALQAFLYRWAARRARLETASSGWVFAISAGAFAAILLMLATSTGPRSWVAIPGAVIVAGLVAWRDLARRGRLDGAIVQRWRERPEWVVLALRLVRDVALAVLALSILLLLIAAIMGAGRFARIHDGLTGGSIIATLAVILLQIGWLPTALLWSAAWLIGPGFSVGSGTSFSASFVIAGPVPALPMLGFLPTTALGGENSRLGTYVPLLLIAVIMVVVLRYRRAAIQLTLAQVAAASTAAAALLGLGSLVSLWLATGAIGPARLSSIGPAVFLTAILFMLECEVGIMLPLLLTHPQMRSLTESGVRWTSEASSAAASSVSAVASHAAERASQAAERSKSALRSRQEVSDDAAAGGSGAGTTDVAPASTSAGTTALAAATRWEHEPGDDASEAGDGEETVTKEGDQA